MRFLITGLIGFIFLLLVSTLFGSWYTIDEGERGILTRNGAVTGEAAPGLHYKLPFVDGVDKVSLRTQLTEFKELAAYSKDQQTAIMRISVNWEANPAEVKRIYTQYGSLEAVAAKLIQPKVFEETKTVFGQFTAQSTIQDRERLNQLVKEAIAESVAGVATVTSVQIENIDFSDAYEAKIEARMAAEVEVLKLEQEAKQAEVTAKITVTQAQAQADSQLAVAKANAEATRIAGEAEAYAIDAKGRALKDNPALVSLTQAERWDGKLPATMIPGGAVPMLDLKGGH